MAKLKGLGRGLDALLTEVNLNAGERLLLLPLDELQPGKYQPRTVMDEAALMALAESIRSQGLMQPILVRPLTSGRYEIIAGERRWRASRLAGLAEVPVLVRDVPDNAALKMALIENIQREELSPLEEAQGIRRLIDEFSMSHQQAAEAVGRSRPAVSNLLRLLQLTKPVQAMLMERRIEMGHARALVPLKASEQVDLAHEAERLGLSAREVERMATRLLQPQQPAAPAPDMSRVAALLNDALAVEVAVHANRRGRGRITLYFNDDEGLEALLNKIGVNIS
jgi:ParB family chromosome partitioning protein